MSISRPDGPGILFTDAELACKGTGVVKLAPGFPELLAMLRMRWGRPMVVTSCCRSAAYNAKVGGHPNSLHVYDNPVHPTGGTCAIDIAVADVVEARALGKLALDEGWSVGVPKGRFLHFDRRDLAGLPPGLFGYGG